MPPLLVVEEFPSDGKKDTPRPVAVAAILSLSI